MSSIGLPVGHDGATVEAASRRISSGAQVSDIARLGFAGNPIVTVTTDRRCFAADALAGSDYRRMMKGIVRSERVRVARSRLKQTSGIGGRNGDIPAAAFLSPRVFARLCMRADQWRGPRRAPVANGMMIVGTKATELAVAAGAAMLVARRPG
jgi:hypothetical protein